ncbi:hypothetical protein C8R46DRAFT_986106 [Mycena filopes]|nr:hypothetical protein C8R46DRAFT_986106 [Mycena filopes]
MVAIPDFHDELKFPKFSGLPADYELEDRYYPQGGGLPARHWCFLAEIKESVPWVRPMYHVHDKAGREYLVSFHGHGHNHPRYLTGAGDRKKGHTMCIMYAFQHRFFDGQIGVRVEDESYVKVLPCTLQELFKIRDKVVYNQKKCNFCGEVAALGCSKCRLFYCRKQCQLDDWKGGHKTECKIVQQVVKWGAFNWDKFEKFQVFS